MDDESNILLERYELRDILGRGTFSTVIKCVLKENGEERACKIVSRKGPCGKSNDGCIEEEIKILKLLCHPNIVYLLESHISPKNGYLILELVSGGELFDQIVLRKFYSENDASRLIRQILSAVEHMQSHGVVHRDLKPENLLCTPDGESIKISDFGFATTYQDDSGLFVMCGTPGYVSPEILKRCGYGPKVDVWSLGVILYILLCGFPPFSHSDDSELLRLCQEGNYQYVSPYWDEISESAKDLIDNLLVVDPSRRYSVAEALQHPWVARKDENASFEHLESTIYQLKKFNARRKFKAAALAVQFFNRLETIFQPAVDRKRKSVSLLKQVVMKHDAGGTTNDTCSQSADSLSIEDGLSLDAEKDCNRFHVINHEGEMTLCVTEVDYAAVGFLILSMAQAGCFRARLISKKCPFELQYAISKLKPNFSIELSSSEFNSSFCQSSLKKNCTTNLSSPSSSPSSSSSDSARVL